MNYLCTKKKLTFFITNQITAVYENPAFIFHGNPSMPSLGPTVTQFTHNRYMVCRKGSTVPTPSIFGNGEFLQIGNESSDEVSSDQIRVFYVIFSSYIGCRKTCYTISPDGVVAI